MVHFIYQEIIIFTNKNEQLSNIIKNICYTNFKIIELTDSNSISSSVFLEQVHIKESRNETILNYCEGANPNSIIMFTDEITNELIHSINTRFLENKLRVLNEYPHFWACKSITLHNIKKQKSYHELDTLFIADEDVDELIYKYIPTKTHVIMATYQRNNNLERIFQMLLEQTDKNFRFHLLDNNTDNVLQIEIDNIVEKYRDKLDIVLHRNNYNQHCIARMMLIKKLLDTCYIEYVIIFDDDQISFTFSQPLKLAGGTATISNVLNRNYQTNSFTMAYNTISLSPDGTERDFELAYSIGNFYGARVQLNLLHQLNPGHSKNMDNATSVLIRLGSAF